MAAGFHAGDWACQWTASLYSIEPVSIDELPPEVAEELRAAFPPRLIDGARVYFDMPLARPSSPIGLLNWLSGVSQGAGAVLGMAFRDNVYLCFPMNDLLNGPPARAILAHELVHVSQYRLFGFDSYARDYAEELLAGVPYPDITFERDAYLLDELYPRIPPGFFSIPKPGTVPDSGETWVNITGWAESFERWGRLDFDGHKVRLLDTGGEELAVLERLDPASSELLFNEPGYGDGGSWVVAVADARGAQVLWRDEQAVHTQWFPGQASFSRSNGDIGAGPLQLTTKRTGLPPRTFHWIGSGFLAY
jgi:hypothetical protein